MTHRTVPTDVEGVFAIMDWLEFVPRVCGGPVPITPSLDPPERPIDYTPTKAPYDPRWMLAGRGGSGE